MRIRVSNLANLAVESTEPVDNYLAIYERCYNLEKKRIMKHMSSNVECIITYPGVIKDTSFTWPLNLLIKQCANLQICF